jgi:drug/metabolite transporter (DMT)-like permease
MKIDKGIAAAVLAPFFIALSIIVTNMAGGEAPPLVIAGLGSLFSVPFLIVIALVSKTDLQISKLLNELRMPFLKVLITRNIIGSALIVSGFTMTTAIKAVLLLRLEPVFVFVWSMIYFNEKPNPKKLIALLALLAGSGLVVAPNQAVGGPNLGDALVVISLLFLSYSYIPTNEVVQKTSSAGLNLMTNTIGGAIVTAIAFCIPSQQFGLSTKALLLITSYAIVFSVIGVSLYLYAFKTLKPWVIASFLSLEVVFGTTLAFFILHETMTPIQIAGAIVVLAATAVIARLNQEPEKAF